MMHIVRWYDDAVTGKMARRHTHAALDRCVMRSSKSGQNSSKLPGGLSALLRSQPVEHTWSGVPIMQAKMLTMSEGASDNLPVNESISESVRANRIKVAGGPVKSSPTRQSRTVASIQREPSTLSPVVNQWSRITDVPNSTVSVATAPALGGRYAAATLPLIMPNAAAGPRSIMRVATKLPPVVPDVMNSSSILHAIIKTPLKLPKQQSARDQKLAAIARTRSSSSTHVKAVDQITRTGQAGNIEVRPVLEERTDVGSVANTIAGSKLSISSASKPVNAVLQAAAKASQAVPGFTVGAMSAVIASPIRTAAGLNSSALEIPQDAYLALPSAVGRSAGRSSFRDQVVDRQGIVPRKNPTLQRRTAGTASPGMSQRMKRKDQLDYPERYGEDVLATRDTANQGTGQDARTGTMVAIHGDVMLDGRKVGRMVAAGQTSAVSLPTVSASAVNLRAIPIYAGTRVPL